MRILWVNPNFLYPATKGGQIRSLGILRQLHRRHEIHYVAVEDPAHPEALSASGDYCACAYAVRRPAPPRNSPAFYAQLARAAFSAMPFAVSRFQSAEFIRVLERLMRRHCFDRAVVDHLASASNFPDLDLCLFFQHNVETMIWRRNAEHASNPLRRWFFRLQADRMFHYERAVCRAAGHIAAVSEMDASLMRSLFGVTRISEVPTGVDLEYFAAPEECSSREGLVFVGSMDWHANVDGVLYFHREVLPLIRRKRPDCSFTIVGRRPHAKIRALADHDPATLITGTVPDVRPYLWNAAVSVVPLRIGGGTRLKIYESMAAGAPVVSTSVGAEGLLVNPPDDIRIADSPELFAMHCLELLDSAEARSRISAAGFDLVASRFSWAQAAACFERALEAAPALR